MKEKAMKEEKQELKSGEAEQFPDGESRGENCPRCRRHMFTCATAYGLAPLATGSRVHCNYCGLDWTV